MKKTDEQTLNELFSLYLKNDVSAEVLENMVQAAMSSAIKTAEEEKKQKEAEKMAIAKYSETVPGDDFIKSITTNGKVTAADVVELFLYYYFNTNPDIAKKMTGKRLEEIKKFAVQMLEKGIFKFSTENPFKIWDDWFYRLP